MSRDKEESHVTGIRGSVTFVPFYLNIAYLNALERIKSNRCLGDRRLLFIFFG